jgi:Tol biopolymer transport system component
VSICSNTEGVITLDLQWPSPGNVQIALADQTRPGLATFSPDGRRFIVTQFADKDCELGVYASEPPHRDSRPVTELLFPDLVEVGKTWAGGFAHACVISDVGWSPDGNWIAIIAGRPNADITSHLYALNLSAIALPSSTAADPARAITIPSTAVNDLGEVIYVGGVGTNLTWPQAFDTVSMPAGNQIINVNLRANERRVILSVEDAQFCAASWTPDGAQLFFALCRPYHGNPDTGGPPAQLYLYTP